MLYLCIVCNLFLIKYKRLFIIILQIRIISENLRDEQNDDGKRLVAEP